MKYLILLVVILALFQQNLAQQYNIDAKQPFDTDELQQEYKKPNKQNNETQDFSEMADELVQQAAEQLKNIYNDIEESVEQQDQDPLKIQEQFSKQTRQQPQSRHSRGRQQKDEKRHHGKHRQDREHHKSDYKEQRQQRKSMKMRNNKILSEEEIQDLMASLLGFLSFFIVALSLVLFVTCIKNCRLRKQLKKLRGNQSPNIQYVQAQQALHAASQVLYRSQDEKGNPVVVMGVPIQQQPQQQQFIPQQLQQQPQQFPQQQQQPQLYAQYVQLPKQQSQSKGQVQQIPQSWGINIPQQSERYPQAQDLNESTSQLVNNYPSL